MYFKKSSDVSRNKIYYAYLAISKQERFGNRSVNFISYTAKGMLASEKLLPIHVAFSEPFVKADIEVEP